MGLQRVGHDLATEQQQQQINDLQMTLRICPKLNIKYSAKTNYHYYICLVVSHNNQVLKRLFFIFSYTMFTY